MPHVVFVADEERDAGELRTVLVSLGHQTTRVEGPVREALRDLESADVLVVQESDPSLLSRTVSEVRALDRTRRVPILSVIHPGSVLDVEADDGIDDFLITPIDRNELAARLMMLLSRAQDEGERIAVGGLVVDAACREVLVDGVPITLTRKEFDLLGFLMRHRGHVFSRSTLLKRVWEGKHAGGSRTVDVHIRRLRLKLGCSYGSLIETQRNAGYSFSRRSPQ